MRKPRRLTPGARWHVAVRCARAQFRLRPDAERNEALRFILAKALQRAPGIELHAAAQMSNHVHLVLTDYGGHLATFMEYFNGQLARVLNRIDRIRGQVFERRYVPTEIVDDTALAKAIVYTMANPASANLVRTHRDWPGLLVWFGDVDGPIACQRFRERDFHRAARTAQRLGLPPPRPGAFTDHAEIHLVAPDGVDADAVRQDLLRREDELAKKRSGGVLGVHAVLQADAFDAPARPKRSPIPLCHASTREAWLDYRRHWRAFVRAYREASAAFRAGALAVVFPDHAFRPPLPLRLEARLAVA